MNSPAEGARLAADERQSAQVTIAKVLARWAPHARHDLVGSCSPISMDLSLLGVKSRKAPLTGDDVAPFVARGAENVKKTLQQCDRIILMLEQNREELAEVAALMDKLARKMRTVFSEVDWTPVADEAALGSDIEFDLMAMLWASLMALSDEHGAEMRLGIAARREAGGTVFEFTAGPKQDASSTWGGMPPASQRIGIDELAPLARYLDFELTVLDKGIRLVRRQED